MKKRGVKTCKHTRPHSESVLGYSLLLSHDMVSAENIFQLKHLMKSIFVIMGTCDTVRIFTRRF